MLRGFPLVLLCAAVFAADPPADPKAEERKKADELLKDAETARGFLTLHVKEGKVYAEFSRQDFDEPFLLFESISRGVGRGRTLGGMTLGERLVAWRNPSKDQVQLVELNTRFRAAPGTPVERAVRTSYGASILATFPVAARHPDRETLIIDLGALFLTDLPGIAEALKRTLSADFKADRAGSSWVSAKSFPRNVELEVNLNFTSNTQEDVETVPDGRSAEVGAHYSLMKGPEGAYRPRRADDRVGYFLTAIKDFSQPGLTSWVRYIRRWHIEKSDPAAEVSPPREPLVYWIENTVPHEYRRFVREGILEWNRAFERIGIRDAIEVRQMEEQAEWDPEDARYNTFRWITSSRQSFGAMGPSRADPRTGRLLDADILYEAETVRNLLWGYLREQATMPAEREAWFLEAAPEFCGHGTCDLAARRAPETSFAATALLLMAPSMPFPEEFVQQAIRETVMHEVGHTLGLRHNFKASQMLTLEQMQDRDLVAKGGLLGSVMEYNSVNISRDPKRQGYWFSPTLGPYDYWAIEYGYRPLDPAREEEDLEKIAGRCNEANLAYATDEDTYGPSNLDPAATVFDMTSDPLAWCADRIALCEEMWGRDWKALEQPGYGYRLYRGAMASTLGAYRRALEIAARWVGGTHMDRRHPGDGGTPFRNVPIARQRQALSLVVDKGLAPDLFRFRPELLNLLAPSRFGHWGVDDEEEFAFPLTETVREMRLALLRRLHDPSVLRHIVEAEPRALPGEPAMTLREVLETVTNAVWQEISAQRAVEVTRRTLQRDHLEMLARLLLEDQGAPGDARAIARAEILRISGWLGGWTIDPVYRDSLLARIQQVLHPAILTR